MRGYYFRVLFRATEASGMLRSEDATGPERVNPTNPGKWDAEVIVKPERLKWVGWDSNPGPGG
jgi:hypothetical protein